LGLEKTLDLALLVYYKRSGQFSIVTQIGMQGSKCGITNYKVDPKDAQLINDTIVKYTAWGMEKSGALIEPVEKHAHFRTRGLSRTLWRMTL